MSFFLETTHLQDILENSETKPVIVFKYSNSCWSSEKLKKEFETFLEEEKTFLVYLVTVQTHRSLSEKIQSYTGIKHESPQVIVFQKSEVVFFANHGEISLSNLMTNKYDKI